MPSYLDLALIGVVLISALLSMLRGFTREMLAIGSWAAAAAAAYYFYPLLAPVFADNISLFKAKPSYANYASATVIFFATLIVVSIITVKISDKILDSKAGALDRSLGFLFGAGRGFLLCAIAFVFFSWLVPEKNYPAWVQTSKTRGWLEATGQWMQAQLPENLDASLSKMLKKQKGDEPPAEADGDKAAPATPPPALVPPPAPLAPPALRPGQRTEAPAPPGPSAPRSPLRAETQARPANSPAAGPQTIDALLQQGNPPPRR